VTGLEAANALIVDRARGQPFPVLPVEPDEPHVVLARRMRRLREML
jgi:hypothetical protein